MSRTEMAGNSAIMENPFISGIPYKLLSKLWKILDNQSTMERFLEVIPEDCSSEDVLISMKIEGLKNNMTPARYLLQFLDSKGYRVSHLIQWFEEMELEKALILLKENETLKILQHPLETAIVKEGETLVLCCRAESHPPPEYQWIKNDEDLLLQNEPVLSIKNVGVDATGVYTCLVTRWNSEINKYDYLYSNPSYVEVTSGDMHLPLAKFYKPVNANFDFPDHKNVIKAETNEDETSTNTAIFQWPKYKLRDGEQIFPDKDLITITKHPFVDGKVHQGMSIYLLCEATCPIPVHFQWLKDGKVLPGENSNILMLPNLYPDPASGKMKWDYQCIVYNEQEQVLSRTAVLELNEVNNLTPLFATEKVAYLVANDSYDHLGKLKKPAADVNVLAKLLSAMNFKVLAFRNLTLSEMKRTFSFFCKTLKPGSYALFSFSGHGFEMYGQTYLLPVDCSSKILHQESICTEYILQSMQETNPALNVLLIDACRKLPPDFSEESRSQYTPGEIFQATMKNNTVYGYSTSFLCSSHESDSEENSIFIKHLKKFIHLDKPIEDVFFMVKQEFLKDPLVKDIQHPVLKSSLALPRKLSDNFHDPSSLKPSTSLQWCDIKRNLIVKSFNFEKMYFKMAVVFTHHREVFCNGFDVSLYFDLLPGVDLDVVSDIEINIEFDDPRLQVEPLAGISLINFHQLCLGKSNLLLQKEIYNLQKLDVQQLKAKLILKLCSSNFVLETSFHVDISELSGLQLHADQ